MRQPVDPLRRPPWEFTVSAENGWLPPEDPYVRTAVAAGSDAVFADMPVTVDGTTPCTYTVAETARPNWTIDAAQTDALTGITVTADATTAIGVANRYQEPPTTTTTEGPTTSVAPTTPPSTSTPPPTTPPTPVSAAAPTGSVGRGAEVAGDNTATPAQLAYTGRANGATMLIAAVLLAAGSALTGGTRLGSRRLGTSK